jgi:hypothetical protein
MKPKGCTGLRDLSNNCSSQRLFDNESLLQGSFVSKGSRRTRSKLSQKAPSLIAQSFETSELKLFRGKKVCRNYKYIQDLIVPCARVNHRAKSWHDQLSTCLEIEWRHDPQAARRLLGMCLAQGREWSLHDCPFHSPYRSHEGDGAFIHCHDEVLVESEYSYVCKCYMHLSFPQIPAAQQHLITVSMRTCTENPVMQESACLSS